MFQRGVDKAPAGCRQSVGKKLYTIFKIITVFQPNCKRVKLVTNKPFYAIHPIK